ASTISKFSKRPYIVFTTAYKEHAAQAFELEAFDYILKPYDEKRIAAMLSRLESAFKRDHTETTLPDRKLESHLNNPQLLQLRELPSQASNRINLKKNDKIIVTDANDIYYAIAREKVTLVYTQEEEYTMPLSITEFDALLPENLFFRCHRSYTVNLTKIREIVPWFNQTYMLRLKDLSEEIPVSRSKVKAFRQIMHL
ncbi:LytTR family DNA-binding domain-containing protein, partial [Neobacillus drentensis]